MSQSVEERLQALETQVKAIRKIQAKILDVAGDTCTGGEDCDSSYGHSWGCLISDVERLKKELEDLGIDYHDPE